MYNFLSGSINKIMRLIFITPMYRPSFYSGGKGGGEISNQILLEALAKRGHSVIIVSMRCLLKKSVYRDGNLIVIEPFSYLPVNGFGSFISMIFFRRSVLNLLKRIMPDVVLATTSTVAVAAQASKMHGVPMGAVVRAMENMPNHGWKWSAFSPSGLIKYISHKVTIGWPGENEIEYADFFIANSEFLRDKYLKEFPGKKNCIVYPSLSIQLVQSEFSKKIKSVMMVGVSEEKGFNIFCSLAGQFPELEFHAIGDRSLPAGTTRDSRGVSVHGWYADPVPFIDSVDLVLVPSVWEEPFGRISLEAMFRKKYVLVSGRGGLPETVTKIDELIVYSNAYEDWCDRIFDLVKNPEKYKSLTLKALDRAQRFDSQFQCQSLERLLEDR